MNYSRLCKVFVVLLAIQLVSEEWVYAQQSPFRGGGQRPPTFGGRTGGGRAQGGQRGNQLGRQGQGARAGIGRGAGGGTQGSRTIGGMPSPVETIVGDAGGVIVEGLQDGFEPIKKREVIYGDLPELAQDIPFTLASPMRVSEFLETLNAATSWSMLIRPSIKDIELEFMMNDMTPNQMMEVLKFHDVYYEYKEETGFLEVMSKDEYLEREYGKLVEHEFTIVNSPMSDIQEIITPLMSPAGWSITDPRTSKVRVFDTQDNIDFMIKAVDDLDVDLDTHIFRLVHITADMLLDTLQVIMSERGTLHIDLRTNTMIIMDRPSKVKLVEEFVALMDRPLELRSWTLKYADPDIVAEQISLFVTDETGMITVNTDVHEIIVRAIPSRLEEVGKLIEQLDKKRQQVQIEAYLVTVARKVVRELGINWSYLTGSGDDVFGFQVGDQSNQFVAPGTGTRTSISQLPTAILDADNQITGFAGAELSAVLDALETTGDATIVAHPRVTVQDGVEATFENTTQVPFSQSSTTFGSFSNNPTSRSNISFIDVGTILSVLPRIGSDGSILLDISSEDSSFERVTIVTDGQVSTVPQKTKNSAVTQVMVGNRQTIVIGGLSASSFSDDIDKIPVLGDIPLFGRLFRSSKKDHSFRELLIFITPTIVDDMTHPEAIELARSDDELAKMMRYDNKTALGRLKDLSGKLNNDIIVAIGQNGTLFSNGAFVTIAELSESFAAVPSPENTRVIIREHPRAPKDAAMKLEQVSRQAGLPFEYDTSMWPSVPAAKPLPQIDAVE